MATETLHSPISLCSQCGYATVSLSSMCASSMTTTPTVDIKTSPLLEEPSEEDVAMVSRWLSQARYELAQYNREIDRLDDILFKLGGIRDDLQELINRNSALVAPVRRLPTEVLRKIFFLSCPQDAELGSSIRARNYTRDTSLMYPAGRTALRLSLVCSRWRSVALGIPELWSTINVSVLSHSDLGSVLKFFGEHSTSLSSHPVIRLVNLYLKRSLDQPLAITVYCPSKSYLTSSGSDSDSEGGEADPTESTCSAFLCKAFEDLRRASRRWRTAHVNLAHILPRGRSFDGIDGRYIKTPLLEVMDIHCGHAKIFFSDIRRLHTIFLTETSDKDSWSKFDETLLKAPALCSLTLRSRDIVNPLQLLSKLNIHSGVDLCIEQCQYGQMYRAICLSPLVESLSFYDCSAESLEIFCCYVTARHLMKMAFSLPLGEWNDYGKRLFPHGAVVGMINRSTMPLRVLVINGFFVTEEALVEVLRVLPSVEELDVAEVRFEKMKVRLEKAGLRLDVNIREDKPKKTEWKPSKATIKQLDNSSICPKLIRRLAVPSPMFSSHSDHSPLLPNLRSLKLTFRPKREAQELMNIAYSRWRPSAVAVGSVMAQSQLSEVALRSEGRVASLESLQVILILDSLMLTEHAKIHSSKLSPYLKDFEHAMRELQNSGVKTRFDCIEY